MTNRHQTQEGTLVLEKSGTNLPVFVERRSQRAVGHTVNILGAFTMSPDVPLSAHHGRRRKCWRGLRKWRKASRWESAAGGRRTRARKNSSSANSAAILA